MHGFSNANYFLTIAFISVVSSMSFWWRDVISEGTYLGNHTLSVQRGLNMGVALFIVSEALFFLAIFWAFFHEIFPILWNGWLIFLTSSGYLIILVYLCFYITLYIVELPWYNYRELLIKLGISFNNPLTLNSSYTPQLDVLHNRKYNNNYLFYTRHTRSSCSRSFSSQSNAPSEFWEWLRGLTDGEGNFYIRRRSTSTPVYTFKFSIGVHIDDKDMLDFIQKTLGMGKVFTRGNTCQYEVFDLKNIAKIIEIFTSHSLNTTKLLNFLNFKKAFELYMSSNRKSDEVVQEIANLKNSMNSLRTNFKMPNGYKPRITSYWLLGFVEGEGSFSVVKGYSLIFNITQSSVDSALMEAIKCFFNNMPDTFESMRSKIDGVVYLGTYTSSINKEISRISISQTAYIRSVLIPFFEGMTWRSKKYYDFKDWVHILKLRDRCHHYQTEGKILMDLIISQMKNSRLSTAGKPAVDRVFLQTSINSLLAGPSNCEIREGKTWIKSLNRFRPEGGLIKPMAVQFQDQKGNIIKAFDTQTDCAKSLNVTRTTVARWLQEGKPVSFENQIVYIAKVEVMEEEM